MNLPSHLAKYSPAELLAAFEVIVNGGPFDETTRRTIQNLAVSGCARVTTRMFSGTPTELTVQILSATMTEKGAELLHELQLANGTIQAK